MSDRHQLIRHVYPSGTTSYEFVNLPLDHPEHDTIMNLSRDDLAKFLASESCDVIMEVIHK